MIGWIFVLAIWALGLLFVIQAWQEGAYYWAAIYVAFVLAVVFFSARSKSRGSN